MSGVPLVLGDAALRAPRATRRATAAHGALLRRVRLAVLRRWFGLPLLLLESTGRRSGDRRSVTLAYLPDGDDLIVVAANAGAGRPPAWWLNLRPPGAVSPTSARSASRCSPPRRRAPTATGCGGGWPPRRRSSTTSGGPADPCRSSASPPPERLSEISQARSVHTTSQKDLPMRRLRTLSTRRLLAALLALGALVAGGGIAQAALSGSADAPPPKPLDRAVRDALAAAPRVAGVSARVEFANGLLPGGSLPRGAATPLATGASGRVWIAADGRARLELQSSAGDTQIAVDDDGYRIYDAGAQTVYTLPAPQRHAERPSGRASQAAVDRGLSRLTEAWTLSQPRPGTTAGRPSYTVRIAPKDDGGLLGAGEIAWDAAHGVPLRAAVYAQGSADPVLELEATEVRYGAVSAADLAVKAPAGTRTVEIDPPVGRGAGAKAAPVRGRDAVAAAVPFTLAAPARLGGLERTGVRLTRSGGEAGALVTYGSGMGAIAVFEQRAGTDGAGLGGLASRLPRINVDGATGTELATALGTVLTFERGGVQYTIAGLVPPAAAENAARGLG